MAIIWGRRGHQCNHAFLLQQELEVKEGAVWSLRIPYSQPGDQGWEASWLRLLTTVPQVIMTVPTGPEVPSPLFRELLRPCRRQKWKSIRVT